jgi:Cys-tRNA(Pro)/Cys-tRNA(Cys) deacylase
VAKTKHNRIKTNAMRVLDAHAIDYATFTYEGAPFHSASEVAVLLGAPPHQLFKTLVVLADANRRLLIMLPCDLELELRRVAHAVGAKRVRMASQREAEQMTGLQVGGISAVALLDRHFEVYLDSGGAQLDEIYISGGQRGVTLRLRRADLIAITGARLVEAAAPVGPA